MSMLKDLISETTTAGAVGAGAVAGFRGHLFGGDMSSKKKGKKKSTMVKRAPVGSLYGFHTIGEGYNFKNFVIEAEDSDFDASDVIAKLKSAAKDAELQGEDTTAFALEDENGTMVKVWVPEDQADDFQASLEMALSKVDEDDDEQNSGIEIAEVLWKMRKDFDITNVEWGEIPEDEEEELPDDVNVQGPEGEAGAEGGDPAMAGAEGEAGAEGGLEGEGGAEGELDMEAEPGEGDELGDTGEDDVKTTLQSVIDMMKADAEARSAEAAAKQAEAEAHGSKLNAQAAAEKVKQEEEILDMEAHYDKQKEEKGETDRLSKLAKYRHDLAGENGAGMGSEEATPEMPEMGGASEESGMEDMGGMPEDEEFVKPKWQRGNHDTMMSKAELGDLILRSLRRK